jgi:hypothetical protein
LRLEAIYNPRLASARAAAKTYGGTPMDDLDAVCPTRASTRW